jgi:hypothetical protein
MKRSLYFLFFVFTVLIASTSCDKIDAPYARKSEGPDTSTAVKRKVLIEDFTGHRCPNCPEAAVLAHDLLEKYPNQLLLLTVHSSGSFSTPIPGGPFAYDFRTAVGDELNSTFNIEPFGYPNGMISRRSSESGKYAISPDYWEDSITSLLDDEPVASLKMTKTYTEATRNSTINVETTFLTETDADYYLVVYLSEDSIIKPQMNNNAAVGSTPVINNYVHMHVLRASYNGTFGTQLTSGVVSAGTVKTNTFQLVLGAEWADKNCHALAILFRDDNKEIMQVEEVAVK